MFCFVFFQRGEEEAVLGRGQRLYCLATRTPSPPQSSLTLSLFLWAVSCTHLVTCFVGSVTISQE